MKLVRPRAITDAILLSTNIPENDYPEYDPGATYAESDRVIDTTVHRVYESVQAGNTGKPLTDPAWWLEVGATNRWRMFDGKISSPSTNPESIAIVIDIVGEPVNSVALFGMDAAQLNVTMKDGDGVEVFNEDFTLVDNSTVTDWYAYFFEPITRQAEREIEIRLPTYSTGTLEITLTSEGVVSVGEIVVGQSRQLGDAVYGTGIGILDFSRKERDEFGNLDVVERGFSFRADFDLAIETRSVTAIRQLLAQFRATPVVWVGTDGDETYGTLIYGYYRDFDIILSGPNTSQCTIQVEGLN